MSLEEASSKHSDSLSAVRSFAKSDIGRRREENQDSYGVIENSQARFYVVADGMGGVKGGAIASGLAISVLQEQLTGQLAPNEQIISQAVKQVNHRIFEEGVTKASLAGMGTTLVGLLFCDTRMYITSVGDSRAYRIRRRHIRQLTEDHTLVMELIRSGAITAEQAQNHPVSHMLTRSLGPAPEVEVDCFLCKDGPVRGDRYLLCSDGLYNLVSDREILDAVLQNDISAATTSLIDLANERGGTDNITILMVEVAENFPVGIEDIPDSEGSNKIAYSDVMPLNAVKKTAVNAEEVSQVMSSATNQALHGDNGHAQASRYSDASFIEKSAEQTANQVGQPKEGADLPIPFSKQKAAKEDTSANPVVQSNVQFSAASEASNSQKQASFGEDRRGSENDNTSDLNQQPQVNQESTDQQNVDPNRLAALRAESIAGTTEQPIEAEIFRQPGQSTEALGELTDLNAKANNGLTVFGIPVFLLLIIIVGAGAFGFILSNAFRGSDDNQDDIVNLVANTSPTREPQQSYQNQNNTQVTPEPQSTEAAPPPAAQNQNEQQEENTKPVESEQETQVAPVINEPSQKANIERRRDFLRERMTDLEEKIASFDRPLSGNAGKILAESGTRIEKYQSQLDQVRSEIEIATRKLTVWYGRRKRLQETEPVNLANEVAATSEEVKAKKDSFEHATWAYLREAETLIYNPSDQKQEQKVSELIKERKHRMAELTNAIKQAIDLEVSQANQHVAELTLERDKLQAGLEAAKLDQGYAKILLGSDQAAKARIREQLIREKGVLDAELEGIEQLMRETGE